MTWEESGGGGDRSAYRGRGWVCPRETLLSALTMS